MNEPIDLYPDYPAMLTEAILAPHSLFSWREKFRGQAGDKWRIDILYRPNPDGEDKWTLLAEKKL